MKQTILTHAEVDKRASDLALKIQKDLGDSLLDIYAIPRGGIPAAYIVQQYLPHTRLVDKPEHADIFIDDIIDSGTTLTKYVEQYSKPLYALVNKRKEKDLGWIVFPWEGSACGSIMDNVTRVLEYIGEDPTRRGLIETPKRVVKSWTELFAGYKLDPKDVFKVFDGEGYNELVLMQDIELYSMCEHHMLPFTGRAHIAYIANGNIIGASKLARLLEVFARRLQVQERLGMQIVEALMNELKPLGAACIIEAKHHCMCSRGVSKQHSIMKTSTMKGLFLDDSPRGQAARNELLFLISK